MSKLYKWKDKNKLEHHIFVYTQRIEQNKVKDVRQSQYKIRVWRQAIKRIEHRRNQLIGIGNELAIFLGVNVRDIGGSPSKNAMLARGIFSKYCIENGIPGLMVAEYMNVSREQASRQRMSFTRSFATNKDNHDLWRRFKVYMQEEAERNKINQQQKY